MLTVSIYKCMLAHLPMNSIQLLGAFGELVINVGGPVFNPYNNQLVCVRTMQQTSHRPGFEPKKVASCPMLVCIY